MSTSAFCPPVAGGDINAILIKPNIDSTQRLLVELLKWRHEVDIDGLVKK